MEARAGYQSPRYEFAPSGGLRQGLTTRRQQVRDGYVHNGRDKDGYMRQQKSIEDVEDWLLTEYPTLDRVDLGDFDRSRANRIARETDLFGMRFPDAMNDWLREIKPMEPGASSPRALASAAQGSGTLRYRANMLHDDDLWQGAASGWWHSGSTTIEAIWCHELGHILDFYMDDYENTEPGYGGKYMIHSAFKHKWGVQSVSKYGETNLRETWAESFGAIFHQDAAEYHQFTEAHWRYLEEYWGDAIWDI